MVEQAFLQNDTYRKVEIFLSCRQLIDKDAFSKSDPFCVFQLMNPQTGKFTTVGKTETIKDNLNPNFVKSFLVNFYFEVKQPCRVEVRDQDDSQNSEFLGAVDTTVGDIVGARNNTLILNLKDQQGKPLKSKVIFRTEGIEDCCDEVYMKWVGKNLLDVDFFSKSDPFLRFFRQRDNGQNEWIQVFESEVIMDNLNPIWKPFSLPVQKLNNGQHQRPIKIECWDWESNLKFQYIGDTSVTLNALINGEKQLNLTNPKKKKSAGTLILEQFNYIKKPSFLEYIQGGVQLNLILAVDFTGSNGIPSQPSSLHYMNPQGQLNQYQAAMVAVGEILLAYDYDKNVPCFGFGGKTRYPTMNSAGQTLHCFPMSGNPQQPEVNGLNGIMQVYQYAMQYVELSGPTYFNPILVETMKVAAYQKSLGSAAYQIMLILTDGEIHDMKETIDSLVEASNLPLSLIIVGVGNADFKNMEVLDGDSGLVSSKGVRASRDLCQFVAFNEMKGNATLLSQTVLAEIPEQVVKYYTTQGILPNPKPVINVNDPFASIAPQQQVK